MERCGPIRQIWEVELLSYGFGRAEKRENPKLTPRLWDRATEWMVLPLTELEKSPEELIQGDICGQVTAGTPVSHPGEGGQKAAL